MRVHRLAICAIALWLAACGGATEPSDPEGVLSGGVLATFAVGTDQFKVWITDGTAINRVLALSRGEPGGQILVEVRVFNVPVRFLGPRATQADDRR